MHRIDGDGYITLSGKRLFDDENLPTRAATQVTHEWANAVQEEIARVIENEGGTLNASTEDPLTDTNQLDTAINAKLVASRISNDSTFPGSNLDDALDNIAASNIPNDSDVPGTNLDDALQFLRNSMRGHIDGLILANAADRYDITIAAGNAIDSGNAALMSLSSSLTKQIDAAWSAGDNNGGFPSAGGSGLTLSDGTWYHVFLIRNSSTGAVDAGFDTNVGAGVLLNGDNAGGSGYDQYRRIGSVYYIDSTDKIRRFTQISDYFEWWNTENDVFAETLTTTPVAKTLESAPPDINCKLDVSINAKSTSSGTHQFRLWGGSIGGASNQGPVVTFIMPGGDSEVRVPVRASLHSNTNQQIYFQEVSGDVVIQSASVTGYKDYRGRS